MTWLECEFEEAVADLNDLEQHTGLNLKNLRTFLKEIIIELNSIRYEDKQ